MKEHRKAPNNIQNTDVFIIFIKYRIINPLIDGFKILLQMIFVLMNSIGNNIALVIIDNTIDTNNT
jgi:hypothetical protein